MPADFQLKPIEYWMRLGAAACVAHVLRRGSAIASIARLPPGRCTRT
jgi:hypothetical protein